MGATRITKGMSKDDGGMSNNDRRHEGGLQKARMKEEQELGQRKH